MTALQCKQISYLLWDCFTQKKNGGVPLSNIKTEMK